MSELELEARVAELLAYPVAGRLPDAVVAGLCVWWLRRRGVLGRNREAGGNHS